MKALAVRLSAADYAALMELHRARAAALALEGIKLGVSDTLRWIVAHGLRALSDGGATVDVAERREILLHPVDPDPHATPNLPLTGRP